MIKKIIVFAIFILGFIYILAPSPSSIDTFPAIPNSFKSVEPGDTIQVKNIAAYFSDYDRGQITDFYIKDYRSKFFFGNLTPPIRLNYPPENAYTYIRDQQRSTFLEEYVYPLKSSIFVNGYEPYVENNIKGREHNFIGDHLHIDGRYFVSKTTLRVYPTDLFTQILVYIGIWLSILATYELFIKVIKE